MVRSTVGQRGSLGGLAWGLATGVGLGLVLFAGCQGERGPAATSSVRLEEEESWKPMLTPGEQAEAKAAMRAVARGHEPVAAPTAVPAELGGMRWSDLRAAVRDACNDVEAAVILVTELDGDDGFRFDIRTIEDWPATLTVVRADAPVVYRAEASVGRFPDEPSRRARAEALLDALAERMKGYGAKRAFADD